MVAAMPRRWKAVGALAVALVVVAGVWVTGAVLTEDATTAMVLTAGFLGLVGVAVAAVSWRWRALAAPLLVTYVLVTYVLVAGGLGGWLLVTSNRDVVVSQEVTRPEPAATAAGESSDPATAPATAKATGPVALARGDFVSAAHETTGTATLIERPDGSRVLTITSLMTDPGPDLRVYLVPGDGTDVDGGLDLGALQGNIGDQEYDVPASAPAGAVVIWCRAFSVGFGQAPLA
jgi:hypothetical protein